MTWRRMVRDTLLSKSFRDNSAKNTQPDSTATGSAPTDFRSVHTRLYIHVVVAHRRRLQQRLQLTSDWRRRPESLTLTH